jgi:hypothetical protein
MKTLADVSRFRTRLLVFSTLLAAPFLRMLLQEEYGFFHPEVAVSIGVIVGAAALLASVARTPLLFNGALLVLIVVLSVNAVHADFFPDARWRLPILVSACATAGAMWLLGRNFYTLLMIFIAGSLTVDIGTSLVEFPERPVTARAQTSGKPSHVVHIVLDEMIGLAAMPPDCTECVEAGRMLRTVLERGNFRIYPNAFSNYRSTRDSLASILNGRLLKKTGEFFRTGEDRLFVHLGERGRGAARPYLHQNRYFDSWLAKKRMIRVYQSDYILFSSPEYPTVRGRTYRANSLGALHSVPLPWTAKMRQLFVIALRSDRFWWETWTRVTPESLQPRKLDVGPVALQSIWPGRVLEDIRAATQDSVFFVHLLTPHYPYVYRGDGRLRESHDWNSHATLEFRSSEDADYRQRYRLYGGQVQFVARQLDAFLQELRVGGLYDSTTVILHGDHGSRLRLFTEQHQRWRDALFRSDPGGRQADRYDYPEEPDSRDLLNQFATLLALKLPGAASAEVVETPGSVLYYLQKDLGTPAASSEGAESLNAVYLFDRNGFPKKIDMRRAFNRLPKEAASQSTEDTP